MKDKKILITGGAGFIGSHLAERLAPENDVIVLDKLLRGNKIPDQTLDHISFVNGDVCDRGLVEELASSCDYIFHLAAILGVDIVADNPIETMDTEVIGMRNIGNAAMLHKVKVIYASTSGIYGHNAIEKSVSEDIMVDPRTSYAMAKRYNEIYMAALHEEKGIDCIALRYFNVYGKRQDSRMVIPRFLEQCKSGQPITVFGKGEQTRDFTFIEDTVKSTILAAEKVDGFEIFNVANEKEETIYNLAVKIKEMTNSDSEIVLVDAPKKRYDYEVGRRYGSSEKLEQFTGYKPNTDLAAGLSSFI